MIAKTETNRAFSMSQFQADRQFLDQNGWTGQAYRKWVCRGPNPCVFCLAKQAEAYPSFLSGDVESVNTCFMHPLDIAG